MGRRLSSHEVREHWTKQAIDHGLDPAASWSDRHMIDLEVRELSARLADGDRVLEVGCANGYSSVEIARRRTVKLLGIDYVPEMVEQARRRLETAGTLRGELEFEVGDVLDLDVAPESFDKVLSVRVLINVGSWENQLAGLQNCLRALKPGGALLLSEATVQGWRRLNDFRAEWSLPEIPMPEFNNYLDVTKVEEALAADAESIEVIDFASTYYVGTRVLKPLLAKALGAGPDPADSLTHWNEWFSALPAWGEYGTQKLFLVTKR